MTLDLTSLEDLSQILPHPPLLTSKQADWNNIFLAYYQHPGSETGEHVMQQHALEIIDTNSWSHHERRMDGKYLSSRIGGGEICLCPANTSHWTSWEQTSHFTILVIDPKFLEQLAYEALSCNQLELVPRWQIFDPVIQTIVNALKADLEAGCPAGRLYGESFGTALAMHLLKNFSILQPNIPTYSHGLPKFKLKQVLDFIEAHLEEDIQLEDLANNVGMSSFYFCRLFKQSMHMTPHQYVIQRRVELAKRLLKQSDLGIANVALLCGFAHQSHLSRHFRRLVGMSPKAFRSQ
ncbi:AraC family transcriptional regulator [Brasilonema sp. UFV-L1]|uniref:helix-turn-helix domain-containing protein n=1 Tax=Brasilonema sp. UFV-L1 TaxID=2234130 RepID=UPI00145D16F0|nr:AraC family transcriptional regulator [Brasilonema sp. UFV-L1]NMG05986.1 AraC family transcriptional regulator [Brasilonema sp. UFV-L1]